MLREIVPFEWRFHARQTPFRIAALLFLGLGYALPATGYGPLGIHRNSPFTVLHSTGLLSLLTLFVLTVFCASAAGRDAESGMTEIVHATSIGKARYLGARFAGAFAATVTVFLFAMAGLFVAPLVAEIDPAQLGPARPVAYLWAFLVLALPNMLLAAAVVFAVAVLTRSALASYVGGVCMYMLYMVVAMATGSPLMQFATPRSQESMSRAALVDPFGIAAFYQQAWYWTPAERNTRLVALEGYLLVNRVAVVALAVAVLVVTYRAFSFRLAAGAKARKAHAEAAPGPGRRYLRAPVAPESMAGRLAAYRAATRREFRAAAGSRPFLALLVLWVVVAAFSVADGPVQEFQTRHHPTTGTMLAALEVPLAFVATLMLAYFAAEVVWRERIVRADEIVDATATPSGIFFLSKGTALVLLSWLMTAVAIAVAVGYQLSRGFTRLQPEVYLSLFYFTGLPLMLFAVVVMLVQTLSPNRYLGIVLGMVPAAAMLSPEMLRLLHGLVRPAGPPRLPYSEMNGFHGAGTFALHMLYWAGLAGVLALLAVGVWRRGRAPSLPRRLRSLPRRWGKRQRIGLAASLAVFLGTGGFIYHDTNVLSRYETPEDVSDWREAYERAFRRYERIPQPSAVALRTDVELYPEEGRFRVSGTYRLENRSARSMDTVLVSIRRHLAPTRMELAGARLLRHDPRFGTYLFVFDRELDPGSAAELRFAVASPPRRAAAADLDPTVVRSGSYLTRQAAFPRLGYVRGYELEGAFVRRLRGLPPPRKGTGMMNDPSNDDQRDGWLSIESTVSTSGDQIAIAPGDLMREWRQGGRRYFRYRTAGPVTPVYAFASGRYRVRRVMHRGVSVEVYHHPAHDYNVAKMLATATRSLDVYGEHFGPYPLRHLRVVELPRYWGFGAFALTGTIVWPEDRGFLTDPARGGDVDLVTRRLAHEVAHQWWGHQLYPLRAEGSAVLVETLASYSELLVLEAMLGRASVLPLLRFDRDYYALWRAYIPFAEPPLARVVDLEHVYYSKGTIVMNAIRDLIGEDALHRALRRLLRDHPIGAPRATIDDFRAALRREAAPEHHALIEEWIGEVTFYHLRVEAASAEPLGDGRYRVTAAIRARKASEPGGGTRPREMPLDEMIDVAVYPDHPLTGGGSPLHASRRRLRTGLNQVTLEVRGRPRFLSLDPFERRIETERADNVREIRIAPR